MDASTIISKLGGKAEVAAATNSDANTVLYWERRGRIPAKHFPALMEVAKAIKADDVTWEALGAQWANPSPKVAAQTGEAA